MKKYRVKLTSESNHRQDQKVIDPKNPESGFYLGDVYSETPSLYSRGEAVKKAKTFNGKIEVYNGAYQIVDVISVAHVPYDSLPDVVKAEFEKHSPSFQDTDETLGEQMFSVDAIKEEVIAECKTESTRVELRELYEILNDGSFCYVSFIKA